MANTHIQPDHAAEINAVHADLLSPAILASTWAVPVPPSMTFAPFDLYAYVLAGSPARLTYVYQAPVSLALTGGDGLYWVAAHADTSTVVSGWTRRIGSYYLWRAAGTQPADPAGGLVGLKVTVAGGVITAIDSSLAYPNQKLAVGGGRGQLTYPAGLTWSGSTLTVTGAANVSGTLAATGAVTVGGTLQVGGATTLSSTLQVSGSATLNTLALTSASIGAGTTYALSVFPGGAFLNALAVGANPGAMAQGTLVVGGILQVNGATGLGGAPDSSYSLRSYANSYFDGTVNMGGGGGHRLNVSGNIYCTNSIGIGRGPEGGWSLTNNGGLLSYGAIQGNSSLYIATTGTFLGNVAIASTNTATYQLLVAGTAGKIGGGPWSDVSSRHLKRAITDIPDALGLLLAQRGRRYEWEDPEHARALPGPQYGFVADEVTLPQWREPGTDILTVRGFEALAVESLRTIVERVEALEGRLT
jgi:hypothetical protein